MADRLKPCPFCGGSMTMVYRSASAMYHVYHDDGGRKCDIAGPFRISISRAKTLKEATEIWNRRWNSG